MSNGQAISTVDHHGVPYSAASLVQLIGRIRCGGKFRIFVTAEELSHKAKGCNCSKEEQEIATLLLAGDLDAIFGLFEGNSSVKPSTDLTDTFLPFEQHKRNVLAVQNYIPGEDSTGCAICRGDHATARCACLTGICFACGKQGWHGSKNCPKPATFAEIMRNFCSRCKLPLFELAGTVLHSSSCIGNACPNAALADQVKMLLLAGRAAGAAFGPDSYQERVEWATKGSPPNIVTLLARVAGQDKKPILSTPSPVLARVAAAQQQDSQGHPPFPQVNGRSSVAAGS
jgi:hypothetical protein